MIERQYTRAEMIEAYTAGANRYEQLETKHDFEYAREDAEMYVDSLQDAPTEPGKADSSHDRPERDHPDMSEVFHQLAKVRKQNLALAKILGSFIGKSPMFFETYRFDPLMDLIAESIQQLNTHFPELDPS